MMETNAWLILKNCMEFFVVFLVGSGIKRGLLHCSWTGKKLPTITVCRRGITTLVKLPGHQVLQSTETYGSKYII